VLDTLFNTLLRRAMDMKGLHDYEMCMKIALKAQAQSRMTWETLSEIKNPRQAVAFVKQANIANGPQQINTGSMTDTRAREDYRARAKQTYGASAWRTAGH
jgi:hypothetical protein